MAYFCNQSPLIVVVVGDNEVLVGMLEGQILDTIWDSIWVNNDTSDVFEGRVVDFLDLVYLYFDHGQGCGARDGGW